MNLSHLQKHLPWSLPYGPHFNVSQDREHHRFLMHDIMHVIKSLGDLASVCEKYDHVKHPVQGTQVESWKGRHPEVVSRDLLADKVADLVICALHMAKTNPFGEFDLEAVVIKKLEERNNVKIPEDMASTHPMLHIGVATCEHGRPYTADCLLCRPVVAS